MFLLGYFIELVQVVTTFGRNSVVLSKMFGRKNVVFLRIIGRIIVSVPLHSTSSYRQRGKVEWHGFERKRCLYLVCSASKLGAFK